MRDHSSGEPNRGAGPSRRSGAARHRPRPRGAAARPHGRGREGALRARAEPVPVRHQGGLAPARRGREAVPAAAGAAGRRGR